MYGGKVPNAEDHHSNRSFLHLLKWETSFLLVGETENILCNYSFILATFLQILDILLLRLTPIMTLTKMEQPSSGGQICVECRKVQFLRPGIFKCFFSVRDPFRRLANFFWRKLSQNGKYSTYPHLFPLLQATRNRNSMKGAPRRKEGQQKSRLLL